MVGVVDFGDEVSDGELQAIGEDAELVGARREAEFRAEIGEDIGDLRDDEVGVAKEGPARRG